MEKQFNVKTFFESRGQILALIATIVTFIPALNALLVFFGFGLPTFLLKLDLAQIADGLDKIVMIASLVGIQIFRVKREDQVANFLSNGR